MEFGAHLPLLAWGDERFTLDGLTRYVEIARRLGFAAVSMNDHLVFQRPWLDGPTALAAILHASGEMGLATTVSLPVVRGPAALAKTLGAIDLLSGGRLTVAVGPGSSAADYGVVGVPWEERWPRFDEAVRAMRALWGREGTTGTHYPAELPQLLPHPARPGGPPLWIGSWGSEAGLRRVARLGDGWLASAYNIDPEGFAAGLERLGRTLAAHDRDPARFPNALATNWIRVTDDEREADAVYRDVLTPVIRRDPDELRRRLLIGPPQRCAELLERWRDAGVHRLFVWPVGDDAEGPLERLVRDVVPLVDGIELRAD